MPSDDMHLNPRMLPSTQHRVLPLVTTAALAIFLAAPALANSGPGPQGPSQGHVHTGGGVVGGRSHGAPGPIAGAGLPFLIGAGAVGAYRRFRRWRNDDPKRDEEIKQV